MTSHAVAYLQIICALLGPRYNRRHVWHTAITHFDVESVADLVQSVMGREVFDEQSQEFLADISFDMLAKRWVKPRTQEKKPHKMEYRGPYSPISSGGKVLQSMSQRKTYNLTGRCKLNPQQKNGTQRKMSSYEQI